MQTKWHCSNFKEKLIFFFSSESRNILLQVAFTLLHTSLSSLGWQSIGMHFAENNLVLCNILNLLLSLPVVN